MSVDGTVVRIVGIGAQTCVGADVLSSAAAVRGAVSGFQEHPCMFDSAGEPVIVASAPYLGDDLDPARRMIALSANALTEALMQIDPRLAKDIPIHLALPAGDEGIPPPDEVAAGLVEAMMHRGLPRMTVAYRSDGHAGGIAAIGAACAAIDERRARFAVAGGVESNLSPTILRRLLARRRIHNADDNPWGFVPAEGASFILLAADPQPKQSPNGRTALRGIALAHEPNPRGSGRVCLGEGLSDAFRRVTTRLGAPRTVDNIFGDMNGEVDRAEEYGFATLRAGGLLRDAADITTPAAFTGDIGAASAALCVALAEIATCKGYDRGPVTVVFCGSDDGLRGALLLEDLARRSAV